MIFLDTSVLVAVAQVKHPHHAASRGLWERCEHGRAAASAHTLAELYSILSSVPAPLRLSPRNAMTAVEVFLLRMTPVSLTAEEYIEVLGRTSGLGLSGGAIYDALHVACARKIHAERIYTWNVRHFQMVAPDLAERIATP